MKKVIIVNVAASLIITAFLSFSAIAPNSEGSLLEWNMKARWLNHTSWDGVNYGSVWGLNNVTFDAGGDIESTPAVVNGYVYFGTHSGMLYQLNASNVSQLIGNYTIGTGGPSSPAVVNGYLYIGSDTSKLYQLNASNVSQFIASYATSSAVSASPVISNGFVYAGDTGGKLYQMNSSNVSQFIANYSMGIIYSTPAIANGYLYIGSYDNNLYQLNATNISQKYANYSTGTIIPSSPAVYNGFVYIGSYDDKVYQLNASNVSQFYASYTTGGNVFSSVVIANGFVYVGSEDNKIYQLNASNVSKSIANFTTGGFVDSSPSVANGYVFIGSNDHNFYQLNASNISKVIANFTTGNLVSSSAAVTNDFVYIGTYDNKLYQLRMDNISDVFPPLVTINSPLSITYDFGSSLLINITIDQNGACNYTLDSNTSFFALTNLSQTQFNGTLSDLTAGTHIIRAFCLDNIGNGNSSQSITFTIAEPPATIASNSGSSGGGGGGITIAKNYTVNNDNLDNGLDFNLSNKDNVKFTLNGESHILTVSSFNATSIKITMQSESFNFTFMKGVENRLDINKDANEDLLIRYDGLKFGKASLFIQKISEDKISKASADDGGNFANEEEVNKQPTTNSYNSYTILITVIVIAILFFLISKTLFPLLNKSKNQKIQKPARRALKVG